MIRIAQSDRFVARHVGGNSTYAKALVDGLATYGIAPVIVPRPTLLGGEKGRGAKYAAWESVGLPLKANSVGDVLFYPADTGPTRATRRLSKLPIVVTVHGVAARHVNGVRKPVANRLWMSRVAAATKAADTIVTDSWSSATDISEEFGVARDDIHVIPLGVDHDRFHANVDVSRVRELYELPESFVLYLGNLEPRKNLGSLIRAFDLDEVSRTGVPLIVAGRPAWDAEPILELLREARNTRYIGPVDHADVAPLMAAATVFAFPSSYEGFGLPVIEAMACGTPVLCSDRGSLREVATGGAEVISDITAEGIADAVRRIVVDEQALAELRERGLRRAADFSWGKTLRAHAQLFASVVGKS